MKHKASAVVLAAMIILLPLSHLQIQESDDSWLLLLDARPVDIAGELSEKFTLMTRNCTQVQTVQWTDSAHGHALEAIRQYSPPDSVSAQLVFVIRLDNWLLAQVRFDTLQDAVVLLNETEQGLTIAEGGVWSGSTHPHWPEPVIRRYLQSSVPAAPSNLTACFESQL